MTLLLTTLRKRKPSEDNFPPPSTTPMESTELRILLLPLSSPHLHLKINSSICSLDPVSFAYSKNIIQAIILSPHCHWFFSPYWSIAISIHTGYYFSPFEEKKNHPSPFSSPAFTLFLFFPLQSVTLRIVYQVCFWFLLSLKLTASGLYPLSWQCFCQSHYDAIVDKLFTVFVIIDIV